jgi:hypothetical protein
MKLAALQSALYTRLTTDAALVAALSAGWGAPAVFSDVPEVTDPENNALFPYVTMGSEVATPFDTKSLNGAQVSVQIDVWSRSQSYLPVKQISQIIYARLHKQPLTISGAHHIETICDSNTTSLDSDGKTRRALMLFTVIFDGV